MNESLRGATTPFDFEDFFEETTVGYLIANPDGSILRANRRFSSWLGYSPDELHGSLLSKFLTIGGQILEQTHIAPLIRLQGYIDEIAVEFVARDGSRFPALLSAIERRSESGAPNHVRYSVFRAIERRTYEENLRIAVTTAEDDLAVERETSEFREQFIAVLGHDLRNPLNAISLASAMLQRTNDEAIRTQMLTTIDSSNLRMQEMINDIMDFARGQLGSGMAIDLQDVELEPLLRHLVQELSLGCPNQDLQLDIAVARPIVCDPVRLSQMISNIVANAVTHGVSNSPIQVKATQTDDAIEISVTNKGEPIPPKVLERLFEPFVRNLDSPSKQGLGLGLFIASQIAKAHGGTLTAVSDVDQTRFTFIMPPPQVCD